MTSAVDEEPEVAEDGRPGIDRLFEERYDGMTRLAFLLTGNRAVAEDVVHQIALTRTPATEGTAGVLHGPLQTLVFEQQGERRREPCLGRAVDVDSDPLEHA